MNLIEIVILCSIPLVAGLGALVGASVFGTLGFGTGLVGGAALPVALLLVLGSSRHPHAREPRAECHRAHRARHVIVVDERRADDPRTHPQRERRRGCKHGRSRPELHHGAKGAWHGAHAARGERHGLATRRPHGALGGRIDRGTASHDLPQR